MRGKSTKTGSESQPLYVQIYQYIQKEIAGGRLTAGERVPSEKELCRQFEVSRITSKRALELLASDGVIERVPGKGSFVTDSVGSMSGEEVLRGKTGLVGTVVASVSSAFGIHTIQAMEQRCRSRNLSMIFSRSQDDPEQEAELIGRLLSFPVEGIIVMPVHEEHYSESILRLVIEKFPLVFVDRFLPGLAASYVGTDNAEAAKTAVDYLFDLGHRVISFISLPPESISTIEERLNGFVRSHVERNVSTNRALWCTGVRSPMTRNPSEEVRNGDVELVRDHLLSHPEITAVFADEYNVAGIVRDAAESIGRNIPGDLSVVSFDCPVEAGKRPEFTHLRQQEAIMGAVAVDLLCQQIRDREHIEKRRIPAELVVGDSTQGPALHRKSRTPKT